MMLGDSLDRLRRWTSADSSEEAGCDSTPASCFHGNGVDRIVGGSGRDLLIGGDGDDYLNGRGGRT